MAEDAAEDWDSKESLYYLGGTDGSLGTGTRTQKDHPRRVRKTLVVENLWSAEIQAEAPCSQKTQITRKSRQRFLFVGGFFFWACGDTRAVLAEGEAYDDLSAASRCAFRSFNLEFNSASAAKAASASNRL